MAFMLLMLKARNIENLKQNLEREKHHALKEITGEKPKYSLADKYRRCMIDKKNRIKKFFGRIFSFPEDSWMHKTSVKARHAGTLENYLLKSIIGFIGGFFLIYMFFMFFIIILNFGLGIATLLCAIFGCILTLGLAFNETVRQIVFLILPQFFSKRGRQALLAYAFVLALTGPCKNTLNNMGIMSESLACGQEQLKQAVKQIIDIIKKPFIAIKDAIKKIIGVVKEIVKKIKEVFLTIKRIVMGIVKVIKSAFSFLGKIFNICSKKVGTPFDRCNRVFENAVTDCYAKLGPMFDWLCAIAYVTKYVCYIVKPLDFICMLLDFISTSIIGVIVRKIKKFVRHVRSTFYVRIRFSHSFQFETTASKTMKEATEGIVNEIKQRTQKLNETFSIISGLTSFFFFVVILKAIVYRHKFLTNERFENKYITNNFREIDFRRAKLEKETILPLNNRERSVYVNITSVRLVRKEKKSLFKNISVLSTATFKLGSHMFTDYSLWWILDKIQFYGKYTKNVEVPNSVGLNVSGKGFVANLFRSVIKTFTSIGKVMNIDTVPCLPDPLPPDFDKYIQIGFILFLCWLLAILEPYGLRMRIYVLNYYYPSRARERAVWLYNHILRNRTSFLKFARRQLKRKFFGTKNQKETKITCSEFLRAKINNGFLRFLFQPCLGDDHQEACVLCAQVFRPEDDQQPIRCATPGCPGIYCEPCFNDLQNICTICQDPIQYGDLSDIDEEKDSSEDENSSKYKRRVAKQSREFEQESNINEDKEDETSEDESAFREKAGQDFLITFSSSSSSDSEYLDSDNSTEYSYSYQYNKIFNDIQTPIRIPFVDVEKQRIPDYVSMETFQENVYHTDQTTKSEQKKSARKIVRQDTSEEGIVLRQKKLRKKMKVYQASETGSSSSDEEESEVCLKHSKKSNRNKIMKWLEGKNMFRTKLSPKKEAIPLLDLQESDEESSSELKPTYSETLSETTIYEYQNETNNCQSAKHTSTTTYTVDITSRLNYLFPNLKYEEVNEQPNLSLDYSCFSSSNRTTKSSETILRNRRKKFSPSVSEDNCSSFRSSEDNSRNYREKIHQYYRTIPSQSVPQETTTDKKNSIVAFFSRLFKKP